MSLRFLPVINLELSMLYVIEISKATKTIVMCDFDNESRWPSLL